LLRVRQELAALEGRRVELEALAASIPTLRQAREESQEALAAAHHMIEELSPLRSRLADLEAALSRVPELERARDTLAGSLADARGRLDELLPLVSRVPELEAALANERTRADDLANLQELAARVPALEEMLNASQAEAQDAKHALGRNVDETVRLRERIQLLDEVVQQVGHEGIERETWLSIFVR
jgi:chromosome segregation ATPase